MWWVCKTYLSHKVNINLVIDRIGVQNFIKLGKMDVFVY